MFIMTQVQNINVGQYNEWVRAWHAGPRDERLGAYLMAQAPYKIDDTQILRERDKSEAARMFFSRYVTASHAAHTPRRFNNVERHYDKDSESSNANSADYLD